MLALQCNPEAVQSCLGRNRLFRAQTSHAFTFFFPGKTVMIPSLTVSPGIRISSFPAYLSFNRVIWNQILESPHSVCSGPNLDCSQAFRRKVAKDIFRTAILCIFASSKTSVLCLLKRPPCLNVDLFISLHKEYSFHVVIRIRGRVTGCRMCRLGMGRA